MAGSGRTARLSGVGVSGHHTAETFRRLGSSIRHDDSSSYTAARSSRTAAASSSRVAASIARPPAPSSSGCAGCSDAEPDSPEVRPPVATPRVRRVVHARQPRTWRPNDARPARTGGTGTPRRPGIARRRVDGTSRSPVRERIQDRGTTRQTTRRSRSSIGTASASCSARAATAWVWSQRLPSGTSSLPARVSAAVRLGSSFISVSVVAGERGRALASASLFPSLTPPAI